MNKMKLVFALAASWLIFLQTPSLLATESAYIYCPETIECSKDKSISSCKASGNNLEFWGEINTSGWIKKGTYTFQGAISDYQSVYRYDGSTLCMYSLLESDKTIAVARIRTKPGVNLEALLNIPTNWRVETYSSRADCQPSALYPNNNPKLCPFDKVPLIGVTVKSDMYFSLSAYANGILLTKNPIYSGVINMYQAWDACSDTGLCTIELMTTIKHAPIAVGTIIVDMDHRMKIVDVQSITGYEIFHNEKENSIEVRLASQLNSD